jgi:hypothetical protein
MYPDLKLHSSTCVLLWGRHIMYVWRTNVDSVLCCLVFVGGASTLHHSFACLCLWCSFSICTLSPGLSSTHTSSTWCVARIPKFSASIQMFWSCTTIRMSLVTHTHTDVTAYTHTDITSYITFLTSLVYSFLHLSYTVSHYGLQER